MAVLRPRVRCRRWRCCRFGQHGDSRATIPPASGLPWASDVSRRRAAAHWTHDSVHSTLQRLLEQERAERGVATASVNWRRMEAQRSTGAGGDASRAATACRAPALRHAQRNQEQGQRDEEAARAALGGCEGHDAARRGLEVHRGRSASGARRLQPNPPLRQRALPARQPQARRTRLQNGRCGPRISRPLLATTLSPGRVTRCRGRRRPASGLVAIERTAWRRRRVLRPLARGEGRVERGQQARVTR